MFLLRRLLTNAAVFFPAAVAKHSEYGDQDAQADQGERRFQGSAWMGLSSPEDRGRNSIQPAAGTSDGVAVIMAIGVELTPATVANSTTRYPGIPHRGSPCSARLHGGWGKVQDPRGRCPSSGCRCARRDSRRSAWAPRRRTEPLAAVVQVVLVFVAGDTVSVVFGGWLWLLGAGRTDQGEGQDQHDGEHHPTSDIFTRHCAPPVWRKQQSSTDRGSGYSTLKCCSEGRSLSSAGHRISSDSEALVRCSASSAAGALRDQAVSRFQKESDYYQLCR